MAINSRSLVNDDSQIALTRSYTQRFAVSKGHASMKCFIPGCRRPAQSAHLHLCHAHRERGRLCGVPWAPGPLSISQRRPYIGASFAWLRQQVYTGPPRRRRKMVRTTSAPDILTELTAFLKTCPFMRINDTPRKYITADRKVRAILASIYRRWPDDNQAAMAILSTVIGTRLACDHEERTTHHPRFTRAMVAYAVLNLVRRDDGTARDPLTRKRLDRPHLRGKHLHAAFDRLLVRPFVRWVTDDNKQMEKDILVNVTQHRYPRINWKYLEGKSYVRKQRSQRV